MAIRKIPPNPIDIHVGSRVRMRRMMLGLSQEKVAEGLGLTFQQLQKYEKGTNRIGSSRLQTLANILQCPVSFFFEGSPGSAPSNITGGDFTQEFLADSRGLAIASAFVKISPQDRAAIVVVAEALARKYSAIDQSEAA